MEPSEQDVNPQEAQPASAPSAEADQKPVQERDYKGEYENVQKALEKEREEKRQYQAYVQSLRLQNAQPAQVQTDQEGYVDPNQILAAAEQRANQRYESLRQDDREWQKAAKSHPELEEDEDLADAVRGYRQSRLVKSGELVSYAEAAERLLGKTKRKAAEAREEGRKEAQVSESVQRRAGIDAPAAGGGTPGSVADRYRQGKLTKDEIRSNWAAIVRDVGQ